MKSRFTYAEHKNIRGEDRRLEAISTTTKPFLSPTGHHYPKDTPVKVIASARHTWQQDINFGLPSMPALMLDFSRRLFDEAQTSMELLENSMSAMPNAVSRPFVPTSDSDLYDILEKRAMALVASYTALEAYANSVIPGKFQYNKTLKDGTKLVLDKDGIERQISLSEKLNIVLPRILGVASPKGQDIWGKFITLKRARDRLIHLKSSDMKSTDSSEDTVWQILAKRHTPNYSEYAYLLIAHFVNESKPPRWIAKMEKYFNPQLQGSPVRGERHSKN